MANPTPPSATIAGSTTLAAIETKVRRLTRSPANAQLSQADLDNYINTFVVYDFPEHIRTFNLRTPFSFYTNPGQDVYNTDITSFSGATTNQLYNFQNKFITVHPPFYVAGFESYYSQNREEFFRIYPQIQNVQFTQLLANGGAGGYSGVIPIQQPPLTPVIQNQQVSLLQNQVSFNTRSPVGTALTLVDIPLVDPNTGYKLFVGNFYDPNTAAYRLAILNPPTVLDPNNFINYQTGVFTITFSGPTEVGSRIFSASVQVGQTRPLGILYYNNQFTVRPIPDQSYAVNFEVYQRPTALLQSGQSPELEEYYQYIAYGAAIKIFQDKMDMESVQMVMPEFKQQERLCLRRTLVQYSNERTATIYSDSTSGMNGWDGLYGGGLF